MRNFQMRRWNSVQFAILIWGAYQWKSSGWLLLWFLVLDINFVICDFLWIELNKHATGIPGCRYCLFSCVVSSSLSFFLIIYLLFVQREHSFTDLGMHMIKYKYITIWTFCSANIVCFILWRLVFIQ